MAHVDGGGCHGISPIHRRGSGARSGFDAVAIQDALDPQAAVFRVHALAGLGQDQQAKAELDQFFAAGPAMRNVLESIRSQYSALALCEGVFAQVQQARETQARASAGVGKMAMGCLLIGVSLLPFFISLGSPPTPISRKATPRRDRDSAVVDLRPVLRYLGVKTLLGGWRERQVFAQGVRATARVLGRVLPG